MGGCYACGQEVAESHVFCPFCGVDEPNPADPVCPSCDQGVERGWVRCPLCGAGLQTNQGGLGNQIPQSTPMGGMVAPGMPAPMGMGVPSMPTYTGMATPGMPAPMGGSYGRPLSAMSFTGAMKTCFKDKYFDFSGRASRSEFWWCYLGMFIVQTPLMMLWFISMLIGDGMDDDFAIFFWVICCCFVGLILIGVYIPYLAATVRRLHDVGKSGWWLLISFVPFGSIILLVWFFTDGEPVPNIYGPVPTNIRVAPVTGLAYNI